MLPMRGDGRGARFQNRINKGRGIVEIAGDVSREAAGRIEDPLHEIGHTAWGKLQGTIRHEVWRVDPAGPVERIHGVSEGKLRRFALGRSHSRRIPGLWRCQFDDRNSDIGWEEEQKHARNVELPRRVSRPQTDPGSADMRLTKNGNRALLAVEATLDEGMKVEELGVSVVAGCRRLAAVGLEVVDGFPRVRLVVLKEGDAVADEVGSAGIVALASTVEAAMGRQAQGPYEIRGEGTDWDLAGLPLVSGEWHEAEG